MTHVGRACCRYSGHASQQTPIDPAFDMDWHQLEHFSFGDSPALADELAALVLAGTKTATCWAASDGASTYVGKQMVVLSGSERPLAIIETVELTRRRFSEVDAAFAYDEGEGEGIGVLPIGDRRTGSISHAWASLLRICCCIANDFAS